MYASNSKNFRAQRTRGVSLADKEEKVATKEREATAVMAEENEKPTSREGLEPDRLALILDLN